MLSKTFQEDSRWFLTELARFTFYMGLACWALLWLIEKKTGLISDYLDLNWILGLSLILGFITCFWGTRQKDKDHRWFLVELAKIIFPVVLLTYLVYFLLEDLLPGLISYHLNLNWLLALSVISGVISILTQEEKVKKSVITKKDYLFILALALLGAVIIWWKTKELGWLSWMISIISGILIVFISVFLLKEED